MQINRSKDTNKIIKRREMEVLYDEEVYMCTELDINNSKHCIDIEERIQEIEEIRCDYCPCGNTPIWKQIENN